MAYAKNDQAASKAAREAMDAGSGVNWLKLKEGTTFIRVLPPHTAMKDPETGAHRFYHPVSLHFGVGPANKVVPCPRKMLGKQCPVCDRGFKLRNDGHEQAGNELLPSWQSYMNVLVFDADGDPVRDKDDELKIFVWPASRGVLDQIFDEIEELETQSGEAFIDITDPKHGVLIKVTKKGTKKENTKYKVRLTTAEHDITGIEDEWAEAILDLTKLSPVVNTPDILVILEGSDDDPFAKKALASGKADEDDDDDVVEGEVREIPTATDDGSDDDDEEDGAAAAALKRMMAKKSTAKKGK